MKPKLLHQEAMLYSFDAKSALEEGRYAAAFDLYKKAADLEGKVAEFYFDKPDLEPTRSVIIRSAAFLNLKAGLIEEAKRFIFFGLTNSKDLLILEQLNGALELVVSLSGLSQESAGKEYHYLTSLRQRSINYVVEPSNLAFGHSVSLESINDFTVNYLSSLRSFAKSVIKKALDIEEEIENVMEREWNKIINPLVTNSSYGSFKISIANDYLPGIGENEKLVEIKATVVSRYHNEVFVNALSDEDINKFKNEYQQEDVNNIFKPLIKIRSVNAAYKVSFYDSESYTKKSIGKIVNSQRKQLITTNKITKEEIGELQKLIVHKKSSSDGKVVRKTLLSENFKSYEQEIQINQIEPSEHQPLLLTTEILLNMMFDYKTGFKISFDDFRIESEGVDFDDTLKNFHNVFYNKLIYMVNKEDKNTDEQEEWSIVSQLIGNTQTLKS